MTEHTTQSTPSVKRLERSGDRVLAGVAGGLGRYFDLNPTFFRIGFVVLTLLGGAGLLVYLAAVLVIPDEGKEDSIAVEVLRQRRERPWPVVGLGLAAVALLVLLSRATIWPALGAGWVLVLLAGLAILWTFDARRGGRRARVLVRALVALVALAIAAAIAAVVIAFSVLDVSLDDGVGDRAVAPASVRTLEPVYKLGIGNLRVDLSNVAPPAATRHVRATVGIGELRVVGTRRSRTGGRQRRHRRSSWTPPAGGGSRSGSVGATTTTSWSCGSAARIGPRSRRSSSSPGGADRCARRRSVSSRRSRRRPRYR